MSEGIVFQVDTTRVLQILTREIYDSPLALLRENLQNAYDAVRMRFAPADRLPDGRIDIVVDDNLVSIKDNGIGMTEDVLRNNFWKAGSSGKRSASARQAGVVGTFGIGAMANFGVCTQLIVETRAEGSEAVLRSTAERDSLKIAEECISLERVSSAHDIGTTVTAVLDGQHSISPDRARKYLEPYVGLLPVPVFLNDDLISCGNIEERPPLAGRKLTKLESEIWHNSFCRATFDTRLDPNGQVVVFVTKISLGGVPVEGSMILAQSGGQLMGLRSYFGLAPVPAIGTYQFGGFANLSILEPTAGREALNRESIAQVTQLVNIAEQAASTAIAATPEADRNNAFLQWIISNNSYKLAGNVNIDVLPEKKPIPLGEVKAYLGTRSAHYYVGTDQQILRTFANDDTLLFHVAQGQPRRKVQLAYLKNILHIPLVPDSAQVTRVYKGTELTAPEASVILRTASILRDDYLIANVEVSLAEISHRVNVLSEKVGEQLKIYIARSSTLLSPLLEFYDNAYDLFAQFMKDFVRVHIYPRIQEFVPSSTKDGVDTLRKLLQRNRELYRYEETELGELEGVLGDYLSGSTSFTDLLRDTRQRKPAQRLYVSYDQVGSFEAVLPGVVNSPVAQPTEEGSEFLPSPPIIRDDVLSDMKILVTEEKYSQLNDFTMFLGLSDRLMRTESDFFRSPHTTRILWGGHRVIYIFTEATGRLNLYYDIELRDPIEQTQASGGMFATTTLITKTRIFIPIPDMLVETFKIAAGPKEFFVRFDVLSSEMS
jgi:molecular chaperone HtpG